MSRNSNNDSLALALVACALIAAVVYLATHGQEELAGMAVIGVIVVFALFSL